MEEGRGRGGWLERPVWREYVERVVLLQKLGKGSRSVEGGPRVPRQSVRFIL